MKKLLLIALLGTLLLAALPGAAQSRNLTYAGRGLTSGLSLTIAGQGLQTGVTETHVANAPTANCAGIACSTSAGAAPPIGENAVAISPGNPGPNAVQRFDLGDDVSPEAEQLATLTIGAAAAQTSDAPFATGSADGLSLDLTLNQTVLGQLPPEATQPLEDALGEIGAALEPIAAGDPTGTVDGLTGVLDGLVADLSSAPLLRIHAGQSASTTRFDTDTVSAASTAAGAVIIVLPTPDSVPLVPEGLAVIEVGPSMAGATANGTDRATTEARASIARITLLPGLLDGIPDLDPDSLEGLPLDDILELLPPEVIELLPVDDLPGGLLGGDNDGDGEPDDEEGDDDGPTGTPLDDILGGFLQADGNSGGFVIDLETGSEQTCILEDLPLETCITVGGTSETFTEDGLGVGVLAAGVDVSLLRGASGEGGLPGLPAIPGLDAIPGAPAPGGPNVQTGPGLVELNIGRSEAGVAAAFVQASPSPSPSPTPRALPQTGSSSFVLPALALMALSGVAFTSLRRRDS